MARQSSYLTSFGRSHCLRLPRATEAAWEWQLRGSCLGYPIELFFPEEHGRSATRRRQENEAKNICRQCPVLSECRAHALRTPEFHGIWGAMTAAERARELSGRGPRRDMPTGRQLVHAASR
jgi:WhiB family transcriptional regulator, redox-sensing transcriptional regulator